MISRELILKNDEKLLAEYPFYEEDPACPYCGHIFCSHWGGGIVGVDWVDFHGTSFDINDGDDGDSEDITCPKCEKLYRVTQHVERIVTRTSSKCEDV